MKYLAAIVLVLFLAVASFAQEAPKGPPDWKLTALELQVQVEQLKAKLQDSQEIIRLYQVYITQLQQEREGKTTAKAGEELKKYKDSLATDMKPKNGTVAKTGD